MDDRARAMLHYPPRHTEGYELEILADLASHQFNDQDPSGWRRGGPPPATPGTCSFSVGMGAIARSMAKLG
jgi:hypothetical protein